MHRSVSGLLLLTVLLLPAPALGQNEVDGRAADLRLGGRVQVQYQASSVDDAVSDVFLRRARLRVDASLGDLLDGRVGIDAGGGTAELKDGWVRLTLSDAFRVSMGQFKRAFSAFELASSTDLPIIERDGRIAGLDACPGVGGVCSLSRLSQKLEFDDRDRGLRVDGALGSRVGYLVTVTNGEGANTSDVNDGKSVSARLEVGVGGATLGAFGGLHDYLASGGEETRHASAGGIDVEVGTWRDGFHLLAAAIVGENWSAGPYADFVALQAMASHYVALDRPRLAGVEPMLRLSWADPDDSAEDDGGLLLTPGFMVYVQGKNGLAANVDLYAPQGEGDTELSFKLQSFLYF